ncbi:MAG: S8 family serine peptidase [Nostocaceae cyanobacterium]|nr:S8 family serine peptidase [Nostocaceae cyanobacterium]
MINPSLSIAQPQTTGKYLVLLPADDVNAGIRALSDRIGTRSIARAADVGNHALSGEQLESVETLVLDDIAVAVVTLDPEQLQSVNMAIADESQPVLAIEPEQIMYALGDTGFSKGAEYLQGYRDAINNLVDQLLLPTEQQIQMAAFTEDKATWGLQATKVVDSPFSGRGIKVAVLDTGLDLNHPDFAGRQIITESFINGEQVQDGQGHGTHCIGTATGPLTPPTLPRYGVAYDAEIYVGKVLSNQGSGADRGILAGINWAVSNGCQVISMSLGAPTRPGDSYSWIYEMVSRRALRMGSLIIAAAGNESRRDFGIINPVARPANCPSIMAVAALDSQLRVANFSNRGINPDGGQIDIAGPGVNVYSTWPLPTRYRTISGTSMATPHVAGIAALYAESTGARAEALWNLLIQNAQRLVLPAADVGAGLAQAPM